MLSSNPAAAPQSASERLDSLASIFTNTEHKSDMPRTQPAATVDLKSASTKPIARPSKSVRSKLLEIELDNAQVIAILKKYIEEKTALRTKLAKELEVLKAEKGNLASPEKTLKLQAATTKLDSLTEQLQELNSLVAKTGNNLFTIRENVSSHQNMSDEKHSSQVEELESSVVSLEEQNARLLSRMNALRNNYNNLVTQNATMRDSLHRQTQANQNKTHWGWYALGAVAILAGLALSATGIGAIAGVPLALATLGAMIGSAPLVAGFTTVLLGLAATVTGLASAVAGGLKIHKSRKNDQKSDKVFTAIAEDLEKSPIPARITSSDSDNLFALRASHKPAPSVRKAPAPAAVATKVADLGRSPVGQSLVKMGFLSGAASDKKTDAPAAASTVAITPKHK